MFLSDTARAIQYLYPTLNFADVDGTLTNIRWDDPLPPEFTPPTQAQIDAAIVELNKPKTLEQKLADAGLTISDLKELLGLN